MKKHTIMLMINGGEYWSAVNIYCKQFVIKWSSKEEEEYRKQWCNDLSGNLIFADGIEMHFPSAFEYQGNSEDKGTTHNI